MVRFKVTFYIEESYEVDADNEDEAKEIAWSYFDDILKYNKGEFDVDVEKLEPYPSL